MDCPNCQTANESSFRYCRECGRALSPVTATSPPLSTAAAAASALTPPATTPADRQAGGRPPIGLALGAVAAGAAIVLLCAAGLHSVRAHRTAPPARIAKAPAPFVPGPTVQWPAPPPTAAANTSHGAAAPPHALAGPSAPPVAPAHPPTAALAPAVVKNAEPLSPGESPGSQEQPAQEQQGSATGDVPPNVTGNPAPDRVTPPAAPPAPGSPSIKIQLLNGAPGAPQQPAASPAPQRPRLDVSVAPLVTREAPLQEARVHESAAQRAQGDGELGVARAEYLEAARLYRLVAQRGGRDAAAARDRLAACERLLAMER